MFFQHKDINIYNVAPPLYMLCRGNIKTYTHSPPHKSSHSFLIVTPNTTALSAVDNDSNNNSDNDHGDSNGDSDGNEESDDEGNNDNDASGGDDD